MLVILPFLPECLMRIPAMIAEAWEVTCSGSWLKNQGQLAQFVYMSGATYVITVLYAYAVRGIFMLAATGSYQQLLADLGYAGGFLGIISIINSTVRSYFVSRLSIHDTLALQNYVSTLKNRWKYFVTGTLGLAVLIALLIFLVKPAYLTTNSSLYAFILVVSSGLTMYCGLFNVVSTTLNLIHFEVIANVARTLVVLGWIYFCLPQNVLIALVGGYVLIVLFEAAFAAFVQRRLIRFLNRAPLQDKAKFKGSVCNEC
jgi:hypothetical protein